VAGSHAATWVRARTATETVADSWIDGQCGLEAPHGQVVLEHSETFLDTDVGGALGIRPGALRGLANAVVGRIHETKWRGPCRLNTQPGIAIHELVTWA